MVVLRTFHQWKYVRQMYKVLTARPIVLPLLYVKDLLITMRDYAAYVLHPLALVLLLLSGPIVLIVIGRSMGGYAAYIGYLLALVLLLMEGFVIYLGIGMARGIAESSIPITDVSRYQEVSIRLYGLIDGQKFLRPEMVKRKAYSRKVWRVVGSVLRMYHFSPDVSSQPIARWTSVNELCLWISTLWMS